MRDLGNCRYLFFFQNEPLCLQHRLPAAPDLDYPVIKNLEILPRFPGRYDRDLPGYNGSFQNRAELLDVFGEHPCDLLRVADMRTYPPNPDKYRATYREEDKIIVGPLQGWCVLFILC